MLERQRELFVLISENERPCALRSCGAPSFWSWEDGPGEDGSVCRGDPASFPLPTLKLLPTRAATLSSDSCGLFAVFSSVTFWETRGSDKPYPWELSLIAVRWGWPFCKQSASCHLQRDSPSLRKETEWGKEKGQLVYGKFPLDQT